MRIAKFEQYTVRAREGVTYDEMREKLETYIADKEAVPPDHVEFRMSVPEPVRRVTPKKMFVREVIGSVRALTARAYWYDEGLNG